MAAASQSNEGRVMSPLPQTAEERHGSLQERERRGVPLLFRVNHVENGVQTALRLEDVRRLQGESENLLHDHEIYQRIRFAPVYTSVFNTTQMVNTTNF